ncbi:ribonuclease III [Parasphingorhabdus litoris]|uniref:Ribonuclease 3 n=1 Tax=Parasphingorhabdus litoris TaxID=394733 RepID=A0ABN1ARS2_9SPHN|nr:ribonuclease III [Parasphingorhabdus litoris]
MNKKAFLDWVAQLIGEKPADETLYIQAFTHGSFGDGDYQRLEFLGDRVLGLTIAAQLYQQFPSEPEGKLSQRLNGLVSGKVCGDIAREIGVSDYLLLGKQARDDGARQSTKVLGDVMESLIGAVYLDHGIDAAKHFILQYWGERITGMAQDIRHPKSALQEWAAAHNRKMPVYELVEKSGPHHDLRFTVRVSVNKVGAVEASASSKQTAETEAAKLFLEKHT